MIDSVEILGFVAATLTTAAFLPQVYKTWKTKSAESLSLSMLLIFVTGVSCWLGYGLLIKSLPIILCNLITLISGFLLLYFKIRYKN
ncbi:MtN3 and saliva related transmembrane protein [Aquimarina amphilecti]|uniref:MtN3 and saliva related transmembrane protein n=1 Tax=Aquimarina amphilecti TaxID=1038014 RepID=A0A1H7KXR3_AQUAM|nr:SemiSWEET transporter [Aquimarina amphilecti]SEK91601.1 MtN3 and saliva related transmembrane protein [Aquimarina amphilecti]